MSNTKPFQPMFASKAEVALAALVTVLAVKFSLWWLFALLLVAA